MLECEGFKMFSGTMLVTPKNDNFPPQEITGVWLYKPEYDCWYCGGWSYSAEICQILEDKHKEIV